ncbi:hypothetical protein QBC37DRAFT_353263 [Rhypophila decipiens]|uniref:Uncharacterized protein n=1 Tax=Rhypophila decipiens TaxID=261697 RepID=A0AAN7B0X6_9PEZI|nr:hypothetical protein QBC37DRAFT_353263 [Rhypophila decipiens]
MRTSALFSAVFGFTAVNALIADLGVPKIIKSGQKFNITGHQTIGQGYRETMVWFGIQEPSSYPYGPGDMGSIFAGPFDLAQFAGQGYNLTIPNVSFSSSVKGPATITAVVMGNAGLFQRLSLGTINVATQIGDSTSKEYNYSNGKGPVCNWA